MSETLTGTGNIASDGGDISLREFIAGAFAAALAVDPSNTIVEFDIPGVVEGRQCILEFRMKVNWSDQQKRHS